VSLSGKSGILLQFGVAAVAAAIVDKIMENCCWSTAGAIEVGHKKPIKTMKQRYLSFFWGQFGI